MVGPFGDPSDAVDEQLVEGRRLSATPGGLPRLNQLSQLAARLLGVESAQVSIIADEQTVMGGAGAAAAAVGSRSPAADSLCAVTVSAEGPVAISDTTVDSRVSLLPIVTSGAVTSYLGVPLRSGDQIVGALCVFSPHPHAWTRDDITLLEQLTHPVLAELELAALETSYEAERVLWQVAVDAAGVGAFDWNLATGALRWDERLLALFGLDRTTFGGTIEAFTECVHPDDRDRVGAALSAAIATCGTYSAEYRVVLPDGGIRWVSARGHGVPGHDGTATRLVGGAHDVTTVHEGEASLARTLQVMPTAFYNLDHDWRFTYLNPEAERILGAIGSAALGRVIWDLFPDAVDSPFEHHYRASVATDVPATFEAYYPPPLDGWFEIRCWPTPAGLSVYFIDITDRRRAQELLERASQRADLLSEVTRALNATLDLDEAVTSLAQILVPALGDWCVVTLIDGKLALDAPDELDGADDATGGRKWRHQLRDLGWWHADPDSRAVLRRYAQLRVSSLTNTSLVARALATGETVVVHERAADHANGLLTPGPAADLYRRLDPEAIAVVPLHGRGRIAGLVTVFRGADRPTFSDAELEVLDGVAQRAGLALDNARLYARQRDLAEALQHSLLTAPPRSDRLEVAVRYLPAAEAAKIGGDWYDAFVQPTDGAMTVVIGDVIGHDTVAAAAMGQVRGLLRGIAVTTDEGPAAVLHRVDSAMTALAVDTLATVVVARLEPLLDGATRLRWSNAGHPPPVLLTPPGGPGPRARLLWADHADPMLGLVEEGVDDVARVESEVVAPAGSVLLLFTDGRVERRGESLTDGLQRLCDAMDESALRDLGLDALCDELLSRMLRVANEDDVALVAVRL